MIDLLDRLGDFAVVVSSTGQLFANARFSKNDLALLPLGNVVLQPKEKVTKTSVVLQLAGWKLEEVLVVTHSKCNFEKKQGHWCPFFWCKEVKEEKSKDDAAPAEKATLSRATVKHDDLTIPCLKNKVALQVGSVLLLELQEEAKKKKS